MLGSCENVSVPLSPIISSDDSAKLASQLLSSRYSRGINVVFGHSNVPANVLGRSNLARITNSIIAPTVLAADSLPPVHWTLGPTWAWVVVILWGLHTR